MKIAIASLIIALLSGMGIGSGGLLVIYLTLLENVPQLTAQGINLLFFIFAAASSLLLHITKRKIYVGAVLLMGICGILGSLLGSSAAARLPANILGKIFGAMLVISGILSLRQKASGKKKTQNQDTGDENRPLKL